MNLTIKSYLGIVKGITTTKTSHKTKRGMATPLPTNERMTINATFGFTRRSKSDGYDGFCCPSFRPTGNPVRRRLWRIV
ncbi:hypothetical protein [Phyllobacterium phragmitis]|uniref:hypothetical protein n=1 Tax=Phyllobacterium phragmitis TaxID=2670329 RepID=UPI0018EB12BD|nr:hypothetical protein [Phyllobacterium phragmitis]